MTRRFSLALPADAVGRLFGVEVPAKFGARYNIAPAQRILAVRPREEGEGREVVSLRWGFVPAWARNPDTLHQPVNARAETVAGKPMFHDAFWRRRCLIPADGFYEWQQTASGSRPWRIVRADGAPFAFAGLWDRWRGRGGETIESCAIVTVESSEAVRPIHDRMPVMLDIGQFETWLTGSAIEASALMAPYRGTLSAYPVSRRVNDPGNEDPSVAEPVGANATAEVGAPREREPKLI